MIPLACTDLVELRLGRLEGAERGRFVTAIKADSREVGPGELFVALNAGVNYLEEARARGAATLLPDDQEVALAELATLVRAKSDARVVAVVGSAGKTTTKDVLGALCEPHVPTIWAEKSLNNEIGLPLTVCRLEPDTRILVTEMGMRGLGQIAALCAIARPEIVVIPHIGAEHLELLGTVERVAQANAEAVASLPPRGVAIVPGRASMLSPYLGRGDITVRRFDPNDIERGDGTTRFSLDGQIVELDLPFSQRHHAVNALAALHAYAALGLPLDRAWEGAHAIRLSPWRGEEVELPGGGVLINDAYNANPDSMRAALEHLAERAGDRRRVAILGEMAELGPESDRYHREIGELSARLEVLVIGVGEGARAYKPDVWAASVAAGVEAARTTVQPGDVVLVKASRAVGLEGIAAEITNFARAWFPS